MTYFRYGEIVNINLVRDRKTGKSKGFCFIGYEDQRSTVLAVDNLNGIKVQKDWAESSVYLWVESSVHLWVESSVHLWVESSVHLWA